MKIQLMLFILFCCFCDLSFSESVECKITNKPSVDVDCSRLSLTDFPESILHVRDHGNVKKLIISQNKLNSSTTFKNWKSLLFLDASHNLINEVTNNTLSGLYNLKYLNLSYNNISVISENTFDNLTVLEILDLSGNLLLGTNLGMLNKSLNGLLFRSLKKLTMISCNLSSIPIDFFEKAKELQYLDLSDNGITILPILPEGLIYFKANNNSIEKLDMLPFQKSVALKDLFLENNTLLKEIDDDAFETMYNLRKLSLRGSKSLERLPKHSFFFNKKLNYLSLEDSGLTSLPFHFKYEFMSIPELHLEGNPWVCNASIKWFVLLKASSYANLKCAHPKNTTIIEHYGSNRHTVLRNILLGLLFLVFCLFGLAIYMAFLMEKRKQMSMSYFPLDRKSHMPGSVYVTTVV